MHVRDEDVAVDRQFVEITTDESEPLPTLVDQCLCEAVDVGEFARASTPFGLGQRERVVEGFQIVGASGSHHVQPGPPQPTPVPLGDVDKFNSVAFHAVTLIERAAQRLATSSEISPKHIHR